MREVHCALWKDVHPARLAELFDGLVERRLKDALAPQRLERLTLPKEVGKEAASGARRTRF